MRVEEQIRNQKSTRPKGVQNKDKIPIYLRHRVTLTFDLLTPKVDCFMPLPRGPSVPICIQIGLFVFRTPCLQDKRTDSLAWQRHERSTYICSSPHHVNSSRCLDIVPHT